MTKQDKTVHKKRMGRPPGVKYAETIPARFEIGAMKLLDAWAKKKDVSRSEAIRRLVEIGLKAKAEVSPGRRAQSPPDHVRAAADRAAARSKEAKGK
jgi:hypothetical protein